MLQTAEQVAKRYNIGREAMDEYGAGQRLAQPRPLACSMLKSPHHRDGRKVADKTLGLITKQVTVSEGRRHPRRHDGGGHQRPALGAAGGLISAGNASQFSDGAGACVVTSEDYASKKGPQALGRFLGFAVAGCEPDEMGIGPSLPCPRCSKKLGLTVGHRPVGAERSVCRAKRCTAATSWAFRPTA